MSALLFVCPNSGREISTGIEIDSDSFYRGLPHVLAEIACPDCGLIHNLFEVHPRLTDEPAEHASQRTVALLDERHRSSESVETISRLSVRQVGPAEPHPPSYPRLQEWLQGRDRRPQ